MKKLRKFTIGPSIALTDAQMMSVQGGDTDPNVCHAKSTDASCSGTCYQYVGGKEGSCYWNFSSHSCLCQVSQ